MSKLAMTAMGCTALALLIASPAAARCSLAAQPIPVTMKTQRPMLDAKVNGKVGHFLLDSATLVNTIGPKLAESAKLMPTKAASNTPTVVKAATFEFAGATLKDAEFVQFDFPAVDGVIGQTLLRQTDVEYDLGGFPAPSVKLMKADGCEGTDVLYWAKDGDAFWEAALTPTGQGGPLTTTEVVINGVKLRGLLSTGKAYTTITDKAAARAGVKPGDPGVTTLSSAAGAKIWLANFNSIVIGNEETKNEPLEIDETNDGAAFDVLLGSDFFTAHHLYVSNTQQKAYFTRAGDPKAPVFKVHKPERAADVAGDKSQGRLSNHYSAGSDRGD